MARLSVLVVALLLSCVAVSARLAADPTDFEIQGLELLQQRYGSAYPGYGNVGFGQLGTQYGVSGQQPWQLGNIGQVGSEFGYGANVPLGLSTQQQFGAPLPTQNIGMQYPLSTSNIQPIQQQWGMSGMDMSNIALGSTMGQSGFGANIPMSLGATDINSMAFGAGGIGAASSNLNNLASTGMFGAGAVAAVQAQSGGSKKGQTTVAQPIYAESMVVPKIITQPILRPHYVQQPIVQQQLVQQPIVETRRVIQPVIRRIITQPIIRPEVYESTTIQPQLKTETIVQPHLIQQTVVQPQVQNVMEEAQPIQEKAKVNIQQPVVQPTQKKGGSGLSSFA